MKIRLVESKKKDVKIEVENPGLLEVPEGKKVYDLPVSHFKKLIDKKGREKIIRGITNLEIWSKNDDPKIASWAKKMKKSLEGYGEKKEKSESLKEKLDGKPVYARLPERALKGFKIGETVIMGKDYPEHWEITDYDDRTDEFILRNYEDEYQEMLGESKRLKEYDESNYNKLERIDKVIYDCSEKLYDLVKYVNLTEKEERKLKEVERTLYNALEIVRGNMY